MAPVKKIWKYVGSMQFALLLLSIEAAVCVIASFVPQGQSLESYAAQFGERKAGLILALGLDDAFHAPWFLAVAVFLLLNLLLCNVLRLPQIVRRWRAAAAPDAVKGKGDVAAEGIGDPGAVFSKMGIRNVREAAAPGGEKLLYGARNRIGLWGAWICHLGVFVLILGFGLGQMNEKEYVAYGLPGDSCPIGDTSYVLTIDDFTIGLREDDTVEQYTAAITVRDTEKGQKESGIISVNHPAKLFGMKFYQNSTGWAADVHITKNGEPLQEETLCAGEYLRVADLEDLVIYLNAFYPDYVLDPERGPLSASSKINNPAYLYSVYYQNQMIGMNALLESEELTIDDYIVTFGSPRNYTLISIKTVRFAPVALAGGLLIMLGLLAAFYFQLVRMNASETADGSYTFRLAAGKGGILVKERFREAVKECGGRIIDDTGGGSDSGRESDSSRESDSGGGKAADSVKSADTKEE